MPLLQTERLPLPDGWSVAAKLQKTPFAAETLERAERFLNGELEVFGQTIRTGPEIHWRRDYFGGKSSGLSYFRQVPYLNFEAVGDHKVVWELNRHQHLVTLAQAYLFSKDSRFLAEIQRQFLSWTRQNPFLRGINWASALEVAFRALSWLWIEHWTGAVMDGAFRDQLYLHGLYLSNNLSIYFSPNTHLTVEATALHALGCLFGIPEWEAAGARVMDTELDRQIQEDGSYFEQSTYYHVYTLDIFLFHALLRPPTDAYRNKLARMADFLNALLGPGGEISCFGDDDGGRFFHPYGRRNAFGRASVACSAAFLGRDDWQFSSDDLCEIGAWWLGTTVLEGNCQWQNRLFPDAGMALLYSGPWQLAMDVGPFGRFPSGHSHADTLSLTLRSADEEVLIDPGTYTYVDPAQRDRFRGTGMHNTIQIDGIDQATPAGPFRWEDLPVIRVLHFSGAAIEAECSYRGFIHTRSVSWEDPKRIVVVDRVTGPPGVHRIEQLWHTPGTTRIRLGKDPVITPSERSEVYGSKRASTLIRGIWEESLPWTTTTEIDL